MSDTREFLRSIYEWREQYPDLLDSFEAHLHPLCHDKMTAKTLSERYQCKLHLTILNPTTFSYAIVLNDSTEKKQNFWEKESNHGQDCIDLLISKNGTMQKEDCSPKTLLYMETLATRGILFRYREHYCLPLEFLLRDKGDVLDRSSLQLIRNLNATLINKVIPQSIQEQVRVGALASEKATQLYLLGLQQRKVFQAKQLDDNTWAFLFQLHMSEDDVNADVLSLLLQEKPSSTNHNRHLVSDLMLKTNNKMLLELFHMGFVGIQVKNIHRRYYTDDEQLVLSKEAELLLEPHWHQQQQRLIDIITPKLSTRKPANYQHSVWENDHQLWRMWVTLQFLPPSLTQQSNWRVSDIKKIAKTLPDLDQDKLYELICTVKCIAGSLAQNKLQLKTLSSKKISQSMSKSIFYRSNIKTSDKKTVINILKQIPEEKWLNLHQVLQLLLVLNTSKCSVQWEVLFKSYPYAPFHFNQKKALVYFLPHFRLWIQGKDVPLTSPGWRGLKKDAGTTGYISAAGDIQLPPETSLTLYPDLAGFCHLVSVEHMVNLTLDSEAIKRLSLKPKELKKARNTLERIQSPLPQAVSYLFERELNQKVIAKITATSALVEVKDASALPQLNKLGQLSPCPSKKNAWLLSPSDSATSFIAKCQEQGLKVEGKQGLEQTSSTSHAWIEGYYSIRTWVNSFQPSKNGEWLEIVYQKRSADALKTCYVYYENNEVNNWYNYISLQLVKSAKKGNSLMKRATKFEHQHLHKVRILSDDEIKNLNIKDS